MADLYIRKVNNSWIQLVCESSIIMELSEHFTFFVPGYRFMPKFKNKLWDGRVCLLNRGTGVCGYGLLRAVMTRAKTLDYTVELDPEINADMSTANDVDVEGFLESFEDLLPEHIDLRSYQFDAVVDMWKRKRMLALCPTGAGKSLIIYMFIQCYQQFIADDSPGKILIVVPTINLVNQLFSDMNDYSVNNDWVATDNIQLMGDGAKKTINKNIVISTWQSIYKQPLDWFDSFDVVLADEVHGFKSDETRKISESARKALWKLGTTGTLDNKAANEMSLTALFGPPKKYITTKELIDNGTLANVTIYPIFLKYDKQLLQDGLKGKNYQDEIDFIVHSKERQDITINLCKSLKGNTLIMFSRVEKMAIPFYERLKKELEKQNRNVYLVVGSVDGAERERIRKILNEEKDAVIVSNPQLMSTGVNIVNLHNIVIGTPMKGRIRLLQSIGRVLRKSQTKTSARTFDLVDDFSELRKNSNLAKHFALRYEEYVKEGFEISAKTLRLTK